MVVLHEAESVATAKKNNIRTRDRWLIRRKGMWLMQCQVLLNYNNNNNNGASSYFKRTYFYIFRAKTRRYKLRCFFLLLLFLCFLVLTILSFIISMVGIVYLAASRPSGILSPSALSDRQIWKTMRHFFLFWPLLLFFYYVLDVVWRVLFGLHWISSIFSCLDRICQHFGTFQGEGGG